MKVKEGIFILKENNWSDFDDKHKIELLKKHYSEVFVKEIIQSFQEILTIPLENPFTNVNFETSVALNKLKFFDISKTLGLDLTHAQ